MKFYVGFALSCLFVSFESLVLVASVNAQGQEPSLQELCGAGEKINDSISVFFTVQETSPGYDKVIVALRNVVSTVDSELGKYEVPADMLGLWETPDEFIQSAVTLVSDRNEELKKRLTLRDLSEAFLNLDLDMAQMRRAVRKVLDRTCYTLG